MKISSLPLTIPFPDFKLDTKPNEMDSIDFCKAFVKKKFTDRINEMGRSRYVYFTTATDTKSVKKILKSIISSWIKSSLSSSGLA